MPSEILLVWDSDQYRMKRRERKFFLFSDIFHLKLLLFIVYFNCQLTPRIHHVFSREDSTPLQTTFGRQATRGSCGRISNTNMNHHQLKISIFHDHGLLYTIAEKSLPSDLQILALLYTTTPVIVTIPPRISKPDTGDEEEDTRNFFSKSSDTGNIITGYVQNKEKHKQTLTKVAKSMVPSTWGRFNVIISFVSCPYDK
ncbi:unnamed protein product [Lepeophtheirus salmonis]|uniref:(salmon louse) hypothetical protein n=1 Tax=Lepeophtheirus salmonis TaxID=72036 RepID=A0A7R8D057_LEPSM|nr:unnamed protein product [Lepeophtheirus salmonis]CAF2980602.1 unnamed protein product [Lepeophtheirus salmonis]